MDVAAAACRAYDERKRANAERAAASRREAATLAARIAYIRSIEAGMPEDIADGNAFGAYEAEMERAAFAADMRP